MSDISRKSFLKFLGVGIGGLFLPKTEIGNILPRQTEQFDQIGKSFTQLDKAMRESSAYLMDCSGMVCNYPLVSRNEKQEIEQSSPFIKEGEAANGVSYYKQETQEKENVPGVIWS